MSQANLEYVMLLVANFPYLEPLLQDHVEDFGEVIPHVFFGDLTRYAVTAFIQGDDMEQLKDLLAELERAFHAGNDEVANLIAVSFVENLPSPGEQGEDIRELLGPGLRAELENIQGFWSD